MLHINNLSKHYIMKNQSQQLQESPYFNISDFQGINKYKLIVPLLYVTSWILMFAGPSLFPVQYQLYEIFLLGYVTVKIFYAFITAIYVTSKGFKTFKHLQDKSNDEKYSQLSQSHQQINYGFIIPSYKQDIQLLSETLQVLASHKRAKDNYLVFLAMESHEIGADQKAYKLIQAFKKYFRLIDFTMHNIRKYEQKGKASNVSWCVQNLASIFQKHLIQPESIILTIMDSDSWAPNLYIDELQKSILSEYENKDERIYQPVQIFTRNNQEVPFITRIIDNFHSFAHLSTHYSLLDITFSLSNYSLSYNLLKRINFWDTCEDAIGEDLHLFNKAFWKTNALVKGRPIYVPFNQLSLQTGNGYCENVKARFWQAQRHARGVSELAYVLKMFFNNPFKLKNLYFTLVTMDIFTLMVLVPWVAVSFNFSKILKYYSKPSPQMYTQQFFGYFITAISILGTISYIMFDIYKRKANKIIYNQQNESILRLLEYLLLFTLIFSIFIIPAFVLASFAVLLGNQQYRVAEKQVGIKNSNSI